ncbi:MAG: hypothetical protein ABIV51_10545, partial [Saprospiraceae bacterium]
IEMDDFVAQLRSVELHKDKRLELIKVLQEGNFHVDGDSTYHIAYIQNLYNLAKVRCIEGVSDDRINQDLGPILNSIYVDSLLGNWEAYALDKAQALRYQLVLSSRQEMVDGVIFYHNMLSRMVDNPIYDEINMNSFNFVNACFDNLLWRYPTQNEFTSGYNMVEFNQPALLFGKTGQTKKDFINIVVGNQEIYEGTIIWCYKQLVARQPTTTETFALLPDFLQHQKIERIQQQIMITDEYANFK